MKMNITYAVLLVIFFFGLGLIGAASLDEIDVLPIAAILVSSFGLGWISNVELER